MGPETPCLVMIGPLVVAKGLKEADLLAVGLR